MALPVALCLTGLPDGGCLKAACQGPLLSFVDLVLPFLSVPSAPPLPPFFCFSSSKSLLCIWESHTFSLLLCLGFVSKLSSSQSHQRNPAEMHSGIPAHPLRFPFPLDFQVKSLMVRIHSSFLGAFESITVLEIGECAYSCCGKKIKPFYKRQSIMAPNLRSGSAEIDQCSVVPFLPCPLRGAGQ